VFIANALLQRAGRAHRRKLRFGGSALEAIAHYSWPGNVRELENVVERAVLMERGNITQASRILAVSRPTVHGLIARYDLSARNFR